MKRTTVLWLRIWCWSGDVVTVTLNYALDTGTLDVTAYLLDQHTSKVRGDLDMIFYGQTQTTNRSVVLT